MKYLEFDCNFTEDQNEPSIKIKVAKGVTKKQILEALKELGDWLEGDYDKIVLSAEQNEKQNVLH